LRDRRVAATFLLGRDNSVGTVPRCLARALSAYERAFLRLFVMGLMEEWFTLDGPFVWLARRIVFALARRPRDDGNAMLEAEIDLSGWAGNLWVVVVWSVVIGAVSSLVRDWLPA
jgi:hypothetical protein